MYIEMCFPGKYPFFFANHRDLICEAVLFLSLLIDWTLIIDLTFYNIGLNDPLANQS